MGDDENNNEDDIVSKRAMPSEMFIYYYNLILIRKIANLHEELFIFRNPSFTQKLLNFNILIMVCWILTNCIWAI